MSVNKTKLVKSIQGRGNYSTVPNEIWDLSISVKAKTAYCYLLAQSDKWNPGLREIADGISMSKNSAREAIRELEAAGMIQVDEGPHGLRNVYSFTAISDWTAHPNSAPAYQNNSGEAHPEFEPGVVLPRDSGGHPTGHIQDESKKNKREEREKSFFQEDEKGAKQPKSSSWEKELSRTTPTSIPEKRKPPTHHKFNNGAGAQGLTPPAAYNKNYEEDTIAIQKTYDHWGLTKENPWPEFDENGKPKKRSKV